MGRLISQRGQAHPSPDAGARREPDPTDVQVLPVLRLLGDPVGNCGPVSGMAVWTALRRAPEDRVANLAGQWLDSGRRVPGYLANALDGLTSAVLLALGEAEPESCGVQRVTVTDTGSAQYVALCEIHNPRGRATVRTPRRWAFSLHDQRSHLLAERGPDQIGVLVAVCGRRMPWSADTRAQPAGRRSLTCEALAAVQLAAPQCHNPRDSGRPPVEQFPRPIPAPGSRPDTTAPAGSARLAADAHRLSRGHTQPHLGLRHDSPDAGQVVINRCVELPLISAEPVTGPRPELVVSLVLQRAHGGGVASLAEDSWDRGLPTTGPLAGAFDALTAAGLLTLADPDPHGWRRVTLTTAGEGRYEQLRGMPRPPCLPVPAPQFPAIKTPARERLSSPGPRAPSRQPDPHRPGGSSPRETL